MNREDIIRMAREAGFSNPELVNVFERFAALVASAAVRETSAEYRLGWNDGQIAEREACAKVCEDKAERYAERAAKPENERDINRDTARIAQQTCFHLADNIRAKAKE